MPMHGAFPTLHNTSIIDYGLCEMVMIQPSMSPLMSLPVHQFCERILSPSRCLSLSSAFRAPICLSAASALQHGWQCSLRNMSLAQSYVHEREDWPKWNLAWCCRAEEIRESDIGTGAGLFEVLKIGDEFFTFIVDCKQPKACSIVLRGASKDVLNEVQSQRK